MGSFSLPGAGGYPPPPHSRERICLALERTEGLPFGLEARASIRVSGRGGSEGLSVMGSAPGPFTQPYSGRGSAHESHSEAEARAVVRGGLW